MPDVFISYSKADKDVAKTIANVIGADDTSVFLDDETLVAGGHLTDEIQRGIHDSRFIVVLLSAKSLGSERLPEEVRRALEDSSKIVIPVLLDENGMQNQVWPLVADRLAVRRSPQASVDELAAEILRRLRTFEASNVDRAASAKPAKEPTNTAGVWSGESLPLARRNPTMTALMRPSNLTALGIGILLITAFVWFIGGRGTSIIGPNDDPFVAKTWLEPAGPGYHYCFDLADHARETAWKESIAGWLVGALGAVGLLLGNLIGPGEPNKQDGILKSVLRKNQSVLIALAGTVLLLTTRFSFLRADAASAAAAAASSAVVEEPGTNGGIRLVKDEIAMARCILIRATWLKSRIDSNAVAAAAFQRFGSHENVERASDAGVIPDAKSE